MSLFRIKICGVTRIDDALAVADAGADAIGFNFYAGSRRCIDLGRAEAIVASLPAGIAKVGVFVNAAAEEIRRAAETLRLDFVQLHGDEPADFCADLGGLDFIRAFRLGSDGWRPLVDYLDRCRELRAAPVAVLADACQPGTYGGTGQAADWSLARSYHDLSVGLPLILAGGLNASNVAAAVNAVRPFGVDTASGVEASPGEKDPQQVAAFVEAARRSLS
ncbi:MAG TPA: phosphoribosylanthranilate isomerase [Pirellulales bacterium]|nr:phosphoribosylanthranilate isomerase [Pirellulales bacterium]